FRIYPNPVHDRLWITLPETHEPVINYTITDLLGKVQASGASTNRSVDVQALASGMYTLMIDHAGVREGVRFVKE
ncbi:MAG: T9SS type A sorting domain-containing protein, partial [Flavobacteriales bacterium]